MARRSRWLPRSLRLVATLALPMIALTPGLNASGEERPTLTFGSLLDPSQTGGTERLLGLIQQEIEDLIRRDYDVRFPADKRRASDWTSEGISRELDDLLSDSEVDMILVVGPFSTAALCCYPELPKPIFAPLGIDAAALGLPDVGNTSGVRNLNYLNNPGATLRDLEAFREIVGYRTVYIVSDPLIYEVLTESSAASPPAPRRCTSLPCCACVSGSGRSWSTLSTNVRSRRCRCSDAARSKWACWPDCARRRTTREWHGASP